jgi:hypothetical protein
MRPHTRRLAHPRGSGIVPWGGLLILETELATELHDAPRCLVLGSAAQQTGQSPRCGSS